MIAIAGHLGFHLIAEGVEDETQLAFLKERGCSAFQDSTSIVPCRLTTSTVYSVRRWMLTSWRSV
ncbi:EAL domain-containing protein [Candidatus Reidiella endopervernicosa]|uniref:EAL domain-containing protein n=1 Tax=Candidatus Reidiella endopervernicosa TaxID=2738883 RepID=A0A6N0I0S0_9GAMM|nr:EAL domain-containing protein [Candidatus Reidiella endopervernicosa]